MAGDGGAGSGNASSKGHGARAVDHKRVPTHQTSMNPIGLLSTKKALQSHALKAEAWTTHGWSDGTKLHAGRSGTSSTKVNPHSAICRGQWVPPDS